MKNKIKSVLNLIKPKSKKSLSDESIAMILKSIYELGQRYGKLKAQNPDEYNKFNFSSHSTVPQPNEAMEFIAACYKKLHGRYKKDEVFNKYNGPDIDKTKTSYHFEYSGTFKEQIEQKLLTFYKSLYMLYFMGWCDSYNEYKTRVEEPKLDFSKLKPETINRVKDIWNSLS